ncbi:hypothetical protein BV911_14820 [Pseudoruegeria sp. SK021]|nr:hypothetical protein BV911_14820 [Pseudoruegeria sp. SK021]
MHAATICPMDADGQIVESELTQHLNDISHADGIRGLLLNGHAGEGHLLTREERNLVLSAARACTPSDCVLTAGITSESTAAACIEAEDAAKAGADAVLVFQPNHWAGGCDAAIVTAHHRAIANASGLPLVLYRAPISGHLSYDMAVMEKLLEIDAVAGIKEGSWEVAAYEELWRHVKVARPDISVMGSGDEHLLTSYMIGSDGSQVSLAAIIPDTITALFNTAEASDWAKARQLHDVLYPLSTAIYRDRPGYLATARLKTCLKLLGRIGHDTTKAPIRPLRADEVSRLQAVLEAAGLMLKERI